MFHESDTFDITLIKSGLQFDCSSAAVLPGEVALMKSQFQSFITDDWNEINQWQQAIVFTGHFSVRMRSFRCLR